MRVRQARSAAPAGAAAAQQALTLQPPVPPLQECARWLLLRRRPRSGHRREVAYATQQFAPRRTCRRRRDCEASQSSRAVARVRRQQPARRPSPAATRIADADAVLMLCRSGAGNALYRCVPARCPAAVTLNVKSADNVQAPLGGGCFLRHAARPYSSRRATHGGAGQGDVVAAAATAHEACAARRAARCSSPCRCRRRCGCGRTRCVAVDGCAVQQLKEHAGEAVAPPQKRMVVRPLPPSTRSLRTCSCSGSWPRATSWRASSVSVRSGLTGVLRGARGRQRNVQAAEAFRRRRRRRCSRSRRHRCRRAAVPQLRLSPAPPPALVAAAPAPAAAADAAGGAQSAGVRLRLRRRTLDVLPHCRLRRRHWCRHRRCRTHTCRRSISTCSQRQGCVGPRGVGQHAYAAVLRRAAVLCAVACALVARPCCARAGSECRDAPASPGALIGSAELGNPLVSRAAPRRREMTARAALCLRGAAAKPLRRAAAILTIAVGATGAVGGARFACYARSEIGISNLESGPPAPV